MELRIDSTVREVVGQTDYLRATVEAFHTDYLRATAEAFHTAADGKARLVAAVHQQHSSKEQTAAVASHTKEEAEPTLEKVLLRTLVGQVLLHTLVEPVQAGIRQRKKEEAVVELPEQVQVVPNYS